MSLITSFLLLVIYLGFAGVWGSLLRQPWREYKWLGIIFGIFLFLPASIGLPWAIAYRMLTWCLALVTIVIFIKRPAILPYWVWQRSFLFGYFGATMFLVLLWTILVRQSEFWLWLGIPAMLAGASGFYRVMCRGNQNGAV